MTLPFSVSGAASPWHEGEVEMQRRVGVAERMAVVGHRAVRDYLIDQHRQFYPQLPFVVLGAIDGTGDIWATIRTGEPGFLTSPDPRRLDVALGRDPADPADAGLEDRSPVGLLGIELHSRRRNRLNGTILRDAAGSFSIAVEESFGNCAQYIQLRDFVFVRDPRSRATARPMALGRLEGTAADLVRRADTFFVASYSADAKGHRRVDVSHRGGRSGFVRLDADGALAIPDFAGNRFFNTLGNFLVNQKAGLVFVDFETGDLLQMTGKAEVVLDSPEISAFEGAERLWRFHPQRIVHRPEALALRWRFFGGWSPSTLRTGEWPLKGR